MIKRTVEQKIIRYISFLDSGRVFSSTDFANIAQPETIRTALRRLVISNKIVPLGYSIYYRPICTLARPYGTKAAKHHVKRAIARRFAWKIFPSVRTCLFDLKIICDCKSCEALSSGPSKIFKFDALYFDTEIRFKHIPLKEQIIDKKAFMYVQAIKELGANSKHIKNLLERTSDNDLSRIARYIKSGIAKTIITKADRERNINVAPNATVEKINELYSQIPRLNTKLYPK